MDFIYIYNICLIHVYSIIYHIFIYVMIWKQLKLKLQFPAFFSREKIGPGTSRLTPSTAPLRPVAERKQSQCSSRPSSSTSTGGCAVEGKVGLMLTIFDGLQVVGKMVVFHGISWDLMWLNGIEWD